MSVRVGHGAALHLQNINSHCLWSWAAPLEVVGESLGVRAAEAWACLHGASQHFDLMPRDGHPECSSEKESCLWLRLQVGTNRRGKVQGKHAAHFQIHISTPPMTSWIRGGLSFFNKSQGFFSFNFFALNLCRFPFSVNCTSWDRVKPQLNSKLHLNHPTCLFVFAFNLPPLNLWKFNLMFLL